MNNYKKSNYAINKLRKGVVYRNADGSILEVTFEKIAKDNPNFTAEDFEKLKQLSDELYHEEAKNDWNYYYHITSDLNAGRISKWISSSSLEDDILAHEDESTFKEKFLEAMNTILSPVQRRRFITYYFDGLTTREIAEAEGRTQAAVWKSIITATKKIKKILENFLK